MASRICWSCGTKSHHTLVNVNAVTLKDMGDTRFAYGLLVCDECKSPSIAVHSGTLTMSTSGAGHLMSTDKAPVMWIPARAEGKEFPHVPEAIAAAADEAHRCQSIGAHRAAALLARSVVEATAKERGVTVRDLKPKIDKMHEDGLLSEHLRDTAHEIRFIGNEMAHGDFVSGESIPEDEAEDVLHFMDEMLNTIYQAPARLDEYRRSRSERKAAARDSTQTTI